jgi:hypothetical protein
VGGRESEEGSPQGAPKVAARRTGQCGGWHRFRSWGGTALAEAACVAAGASDGGIVALDVAAVRRAEQDKEAAQIASLARRFTALVRNCATGQPTRPAAPVADLDAWLAEARVCGIGAVETFAAGLERDGAAVRAALTEPWSSGQAEDQINRLKLLKRQSYGRASFDLLRQRVLIAA